MLFYLNCFFRFIRKWQWSWSRLSFQQLGIQEVKKKQENYEKFWTFVKEMLPIYCEQWHKWFFWRKKKEGLSEKKKTILSWCVMFKIQKKDMFKWKQKHIYSCVNLFFLPINYLASYLYNFICLIKKNPSDC